MLENEGFAKHNISKNSDLDCNISESIEQINLVSNFNINLNEKFSRPITLFPKLSLENTPIKIINHKEYWEEKKIPKYVKLFNLDESYGIERTKADLDNQFYFPNKNNSNLNTNCSLFNENHILRLNMIDKDNYDLEEIPFKDIEGKYFSKIVSYRFNKIFSIPIFITKFISLQELRLDHNQISQLPLALSKLNFLQVFTISHNLIKEIPDYLKSLTMLSTFEINNNLIENFPNFLCFLQLKELMIQNNQIISIPTSFYKLITLNILGIDWFNYIREISPNNVIHDHDSFLLNKLRSLCKLLDDKGKCYFLDFILDYYNTSIGELHLKKEFLLNRNILHMCAIQGKKYIVDSFLKTNFNLNEVDEYNSTPFALALRANQFETSLLILSNENCNPNIVSRKYGLPLHLMLKSKNFFIAQKIIESKNFDPCTLDSEGNNAIHLLFSTNQGEFISNVETLSRILLEKGVNSNQLNKFLLAPINLAIKKNNLKAIIFAKSYNKNYPAKMNKFDFNLKAGKFDWSPLHYAVIYSDIEIVVNILNNNNINLFAKDIQSRTPRDLALINTLLSKILQKAESSYVKNCFSMHLKYIKNATKIINKINFKVLIYSLVGLKVVKIEDKSIDQSELNEGKIETSGKIQDYQNDMPFQRLSMQKMNMITRNINPKPKQILTLNQNESKKQKQQLKLKVNLHINFIHNELSNKQEKLLDKESQNIINNLDEDNSDDMKEKQQFVNKLMEHRSMKIIKFPEKEKIHKVYRNNITLRINNSIKAINYYQKADMNKNITKGYKELQEASLLRKNTFSSEYKQIVKAECPNYRKIRMLYKVLNIENKSSRDVSKLLFESNMNNPLFNDLVYIGSLKGKINQLLNLNGESKLLTYELENSLECIKNEVYFSLNKEKLHNLFNRREVGERSKSVGESSNFSKASMKSKILSTQNRKSHILYENPKHPNSKFQ